MSGAERRRAVLRGIFRLATFRADGFADFAGTPQAFLNSLAPLIAFPLVGSVGLLLDGQTADAIANLLGTIIVLLAPAVLSEALAARWGRAAEWCRYAVACNWCQWAVAFAAGILVLPARALLAADVPPPAVVTLALFTLLAYACMLQWFLARYGLRLSRLRALALTIAIGAGTGALLLGPSWVAGWFA